MKKKISRRKLLLGSVAAASSCAFNPLQVLLAHMMNGMLGKAYAEISGVTPRNYIYIHQRGGPQKWVWDPIVAYDDKSMMISNPGVITRFVDSGGKYLSGEYVTTNQNGVNMPWLWQYDIPLSGGGTASMSSLMDSMMIIMGIDVNNPSHSGARAAQYYPLGIANSVTSLSSDNSAAPIPHVSLNVQGDMFKSKAGKTGIHLSAGSSTLGEILSPFSIDPTSSFHLNKNLIDKELKQLSSSFYNYSKAMHPGSFSLLPNKKNAEDLMVRNFGNLLSVYGSLYNKYKDLIDIVTDPMTNSLAGISDKQVGEDDKLRLSVQTGNLNRVASQFAITEFLITNGLTQSINFNLFHFAQPDPATYTRFRYDSHSEGFLANTISNTFLNLAIGTCIKELTSVFKQKNIYKDTLIQLSGEFNRTPKNDGSGSDHGYKNSSTTFFSGAIEDFQLIGNTGITAHNSTHLGTYGWMADNPGYGTLNLGHLAASIATMTRTRSPVTSSPTLVKEENGVIKSKLPKARLIANDK